MDSSRGRTSLQREAGVAVSEGSQRSVTGLHDEIVSKEMVGVVEAKAEPEDSLRSRASDCVEASSVVVAAFLELAPGSISMGNDPAQAKTRSPI